MEAYVQERLSSVPGHLGFYYLDLTSGETAAYHADDTYEAASVIKLPVLAAVALRAETNPALLREKLLIREEEKMPGCGALQHITGEQSYDVETLCRLMTTISDNTAVNALIRHFGIEALNEDFRQLGLDRTKLYRLLFDSEAAARGLENLFVPREIGGLLERIYRRTCVSPAASAWMESILLRQQINQKIPGQLPPEVPVAHKTGEDDGITNDVGIVYGDHPMVVVFAGNKTIVPAYEQVIRDVSVYYYNKD